MRDGERRRGPFGLLEAASLMSGGANGMVTVVLPWLALERTGSAAVAGIVGTATALPLLLSSLVTGSIVDRIGRKRAAIISDALSGLSVLAIPVVDRLDALNTGSLMVLAVLGAMFDPPGFSAREALLPEVADAAGMRLERVNGIHEAVSNLAFVIGPGLGGLLIAGIGAASAMGVAAVGFAVSAVFVGTIRLHGLEGHGGAPAPRLGAPLMAGPAVETTLTPPLQKALWAETKEGLAVVWHDPLLRAVLLLNSGVLAAYLPFEAVLFPVFFEQQDAPERMGFVLTAFSAGGIGGAVAYAVAGHRFPRRRFFVGASVFAGAGLAAMALLPPYPVILILAIAVGLVYSPVNPLVNLAIQTRAPAHARGRVTALLNSSAYAAGPLGFVVVGLLVERIGLRPTFLLVGISVLVVALCGIPSKGLRTFDDEPDDEPEPEPGA